MTSRTLPVFPREDTGMKRSALEGDFPNDRFQWRSQTYFQEEATFTPPSRKRGPGNSTTGIFVEFCIAVGDFWYIFGERKQTSLYPETGVRSNIPGKRFEFGIAVGEF